MVTNEMAVPAAEPVALPALHWRFSLAMVRAVLGFLCCVFALAATGSLARPSVLLWGAYTTYALLAAFSKQFSLEHAGYRLLGLLVDTIFFLICAALPTEYNAGITASFYLFVLISAALLHTTREIFIVVCVTLIFLFVTRPTEMLVFSPAALLSGTAVAIMTVQRQALQDRLRAAARQAMMFRSEAEHAKEAERQRIAHDFHDGPLQVFVGLQMRLQVIRQMLDKNPEAARREMEELQQLAKSQGEEIRSFVRSMRPPEIDGSGLVPSIKKQVEAFQRDSGVECTFVGSNTRITLTDQLATEIMQIVREALHNVQKHAKAKRVTVGVGRDGDIFELSIEDDGRGFPFSGAFTLEELDQLRRGPVTIRSRVRLLNGEMMLDTQSGHGSVIKIRVAV